VDEYEFDGLVKAGYIEVNPDGFAIPTPPLDSTPLRSWNSVPRALAELEIPILISASGVQNALAKLLAGSSDISSEDQAAFGRLNYYAYLGCFRPPIGLTTTATTLDEGFAKIVKDLVDAGELDMLSCK
jgi:hypothetical protein